MTRSKHKKIEGKPNDPAVHKLDKLMALYNEYTRIIAHEHHKCRDGLLAIEYDAYQEAWTVELPLYCFDDLTTYGANIDALLDAAIEHMENAIKYQNELIKDGVS